MFIGRKRELSQLSQVISEDRPTIAVIYGRRRIGKSELIKEATKGKKTWFFEGLEGRPKPVQIDNFLFQLSEQTSESIEDQISTWRKAFSVFLKCVKKGTKPPIVVFDEFQWTANYRAEIISDLKMMWDQYFSKIPGITLILCGSIASFMTQKVIKSKALYGRTELIIHLKGFRLQETHALLKDRGVHETLEAQMIVGGVPQYLTLLKKYPSVSLGIEELAFRENGYFVNEFERIFSSHFGSNPNFRKIIELLGAHPYGLFRKEITKLGDYKPGGRISEHLFDLESAGFLFSHIPIHKDHNSKLKKYILLDAYIRFYLAFIVPHMTEINTGTNANLFTSITQSGQYHNWMGRSFEYLCMEHAQKLSEILGFPGIKYKVGPFFQSTKKSEKGVQIDLVFSRADHVLTLCEMKWSAAPIGTEIIPEIEKKVTILQKYKPSATIQRVLVIHGTVTKALENAGYLYRIIPAQTLIE